MNYFEKIKRLVNDRYEPARDKRYNIFCCLIDAVEDGRLTRFTFADAYVIVQETMPEANFGDVQHSVRMLDFMGRVKWLGSTRRGDDYIPMFQAQNVE